MKHTYSILVAAAIIACALSPPAAALPTMIRLGYPNCASCHISPQGGGLLNSYGRGIDEAQSFKGGEYRPSDNGLWKTLSWGGRITQDVRTVTQEQVSTATDKPVVGLLRSRAMYRNATELGKGFRFSAVVTGENESAPRPALKYDAPIPPGQVYVNTALLSYRPTKTLEFAVGRDQLPSGVNGPDLGLFIRSRNRMGYYDSPTQAKLFWWGKRYHVNPYAFGPSGNERSGWAESGGGSLAEFDVLGNGRTVAGVNFLQGSARNGSRRMVGPYVRLGFGKWGILAEHDITDRSVIQPATANFRQTASWGQIFWAPREWLVAYLSAERLEVEKPYRERLIAARFDLVARLSNQVTIGIGTRLQRNMVTGQRAPAVALQLALKTVN